MCALHVDGFALHPYYRQSSLKNDGAIPNKYPYACVKFVYMKLTSFAEGGASPSRPGCYSDSTALHGADLKTLNGLKWNIIAPAALLALALVAVVWFDATSGGEATPEPFIGDVGTPVRSAYVPNPTPAAAVVPTAVIRPGTNVAAGTPDLRDAQRRTDLLLLLVAANTVRADDGEFPTTNGNVQTLCVFQEYDIGCTLEDALGSPPPVDPLGNPGENGYWYSSDGATMRIYASLEGAIPETEQCVTDNAELNKQSNLICVQAP